MTVAFDRDALLDAFDRIGRAAVEAGTKLQIAVYGGSALMLASNFRGFDRRCSRLRTSATSSELARQDGAGIGRREALA